jgi:hypothetical protein
MIVVTYIVRNHTSSFVEVPTNFVDRSYTEYFKYQKGLDDRSF